MNKAAASVLRFMDAVDSLLLLVAKCLLVVMTAMAFISIIGRTLFQMPIPDDLLLSELMMVALVFLPLSYVQSVGGHLQVTILTDLFPPRVQSFLVGVGLVVSIVFFGIMAYHSWFEALDSLEFQETGFSSVLDIPLWPAKLVIPVALMWWCLRMLLELFVPGARREAETEVSNALAEAERATAEPTTTASARNAEPNQREEASWSR